MREFLVSSSLTPRIASTYVDLMAEAEIMMPGPAAASSGPPSESDGDRGNPFDTRELSTAALLAHNAAIAMQQDNEHVSSLGTVDILLVEDDENQQQALLALFDSANSKNGGSVIFAVTVASNATEALSLVNSDPSRFNLILLDMLLPDTNGYDLLPRLRSVIGGDVAIVMASANSQMSCGYRGFQPAPLSLSPPASLA